MKFQPVRKPHPLRPHAAAFWVVQITHLRAPDATPLPELHQPSFEST